MSRAWSWRHAIAQSDLQPNTRYVLMMLSIHMNEMGEGCYPSVADLINETGLDKKTVLKHLSLAEDAGWIAVSNMGLRGQKWKQRSYVAAWPERQLTGAEMDAAEDEAGGTVPPACQEKQGESFPEAGGMVPPKQGEQFHQDNIVPVTSNNIPEREGARERADFPDYEKPETESAEPGETRKALERRFNDLLKNWPNAKGLPKRQWWKAWIALTPEERALAEQRCAAWHRLLKRQKRDFPPMPSTYFAEKLWQDIDEAKESDAEKPDRSSVDRAPPFGPAWGAKRMALLLQGPADMPERHQLRGLFAAKYEIFSRSGGGAALRYAKRCGVSVSADGRISFPDDFEERELARRTMEGFPGVNALDRAARDRQKEPVEAGFVSLADAMEPVPVGTDMWRRWEDWHADNHLPFVPETGNQRVVYFPKGGPDGLEAFKRAAAAATNQEAAE